MRQIKLIADRVYLPNMVGRDRRDSRDNRKYPNMRSLRCKIQGKVYNYRYFLEANISMANIGPHTDWLVLLGC